MSFSIKREEQVAVFIDGQNLSRSIANLKNDKYAMVDFDKLVPKVLDGRNLSKMTFFTEGSEVPFKFKKRIMENFGGEAVACGKGADVPLAVNAILTAVFKKVDTIIIMSGDRDFKSLIQSLKTLQLKVEVCAVKDHVGYDFIQMADKFHEIQDEFYIFNPNHINRHQEQKLSEAAPPQSNEQTNN